MNDLRSHSNRAVELAVRHGIVLDREFGALVAWEFMRAQGIDALLIFRVLLHEEKCRSSDLIAIHIAKITMVEYKVRPAVHKKQEMITARLRFAKLLRSADSSVESKG